MAEPTAADNPDGDVIADGVVDIVNPQAGSDVLLVCEHASAHIPAQFATLGLDPQARSSHIAWDPGALAVARRMAERLDATLIAQRVSRLVYDCNRPPENLSAIPEKSEIYDVPGNHGLTDSQRAERVALVYEPFRKAVAGLLDKRLAVGRTPVLVTVHSFTPVYFGKFRPVEIGILHDEDSRLADALLNETGWAGDYKVCRNQPYGPDDGVTHTLKLHALPRRLQNVMIEIRNDLLADRNAQAGMADRLYRALAGALEGSAAEMKTRGN